MRRGRASRGNRIPWEMFYSESVGLICILMAHNAYQRIITDLSMNGLDFDPNNVLKS